MWDLEEELREAQRIGRIGSWCWDATSDGVEGSEELHRLFGFEDSGEALPDFEAMRGRCFPAKDWERVKEAMREALRSGESFEVEVRAIRNGGTLWVAMRGMPVRDPESGFVGVRGTVQDITDRKRSELNAAFLAQTEEGFSKVSSAQGLVESLGEKTGAYLKAPFLSVCEVELEGAEHELRLIYQWADGEKRSLGRPILVECLKEAYHEEVCQGDVVVIRDTELDERIEGGRCGALEIRSMVIAPFQADGKWRYFLSVADTMPRDWRLDEVSLVQEVASRIFPRLAQARIQEALRESEARLQAALVGGDLGTWDVDLKTGEVAHSRRHDEIWGYEEPVEEWTVEMAKARLYPEDRLRFERAYEAALKTGSLSEEVRIVDPRGNVRWIASSGRVRYDEEGRPVGLTGVVEDITERKASEEALRRSEERLKVAVKNAAFISAETDRDLRYTWIFNPHRDFDPDEVLGKTDVELEDVEGARRFYALKKQVLATERGGREEIEFERSNGRRVYDMIVEPRRDACGNVVGVSTVSFDVTEQREAEEALLEADRRKDEFIAVLSHELRNPLTPIRAGIELLKGAYNSPASRAMVPVLERQVGHIGRLLDDLLNLSRISRGKLKLRKEPVELNEAIERALETTRPDIESKNHDLRVALLEEPIILDADPVRIAQVFSNLLTNASKYMEVGGLIEVRSRLESNEVIVSVKDEGIGLSEAQTSSIFDMFAQVETARERGSRFHEGLGIGLSLVKKLVELHGGRVEAKSEGLGKGSEFRVYLPVLNQVRTEENEVKASQEEGKTKILLNDDNEDISKSLSMLLELAGHQVEVANRGQQALEAAATYLPDLVLLDIGMPEMDGYEVCRRLRATTYGKEMYIVALTGWGQEEDRRKSMDAGFDAHLVKPLDMEALRALIEGVKEG